MTKHDERSRDAAIGVASTLRAVDVDVLIVVGAGGEDDEQ
jgi:hypothetical protein